MCDVEAECTVSVWHETWVTARREHTCVCGESIKPGARYRVTSVLWYGGWGRWKHCARCSAVLDAIRDEWRRRGALEMFTTDTLNLCCGESWQAVFDEDPPEHVAALAFVLPGDIVNE